MLNAYVLYEEIESIDLIRPVSITMSINSSKDTTSTHIYMASRFNSSAPLGIIKRQVNRLLSSESSIRNREAISPELDERKVRIRLAGS